MLYVEDMGKALDIYSKLGASIVTGSRDGDWALLRFGTTELGLLAHPANPEQNEGKVELNFEFTSSLEDLEKKLRETGVTIVVAQYNLLKTLHYSCLSSRESY